MIDYVIHHLIRHKFSNHTLHNFCSYITLDIIIHSHNLSESYFQSKLSNLRLNPRRGEAFGFPLSQEQEYTKSTGKKFITNMKFVKNILLTKLGLLR